MSESLAPNLRRCDGVCHGGMLHISHYVHKQQLSNLFRYINMGAEEEDELPEEGVTLC